MPEPTKRITVDSVDFSELFQFQRIFHAISASLQPPRLIIGLLLVLAIITFGKGWDRYDRWRDGGPDISPYGLHQGDATDFDRAASKRTLLGAIKKYVPEEDRPQPDTDVTAWALEDMLALQPKMPGYYREFRATIENESQLERSDAEFANVMGEINRTRLRSPWEATSKAVSDGFRTIIQGSLSFSLPGMYAGLGDIFYRTPIALWKVDKAFTIVFGLFLLMVLAIGGGALSRMAATQIAGQERLRVRTALGFSVYNWRRFLFALLLPVLLALIIAGIIILIGVLMAVPWLDIIGGAVYGLALALGFVFAFLLFGFAAGFSLLVPAVAVENCDPGDAMQRAFAYVVNRPLHLLWYFFIALIGLVLGYLVVAFIASVMLNITAESFGALNNHPAIAAAGGFSILDLTRETHPVFFETWHAAAAGWLTHLWEVVIACLVFGYIFVYYYSASTVIYLLMRRAADGQDIEEIWRPGLVPGTMAPEPEPAKRV